MKLLQTPLYQECKELGGKMVPFANWEMPVSFSGLIEEHNAVRKMLECSTYLTWVLCN